MTGSRKGAIVLSGRQKAKCINGPCWPFISEGSIVRLVDDTVDINKKTGNTIAS